MVIPHVPVDSYYLPSSTSSQTVLLVIDILPHVIVPKASSIFPTLSLIASVQTHSSYPFPQLLEELISSSNTNLRGVNQHLHLTLIMNVVLSCDVCSPIISATLWSCSILFFFDSESLVSIVTSSANVDKNFFM